jgi:hypothetical protein
MSFVPVGTPVSDASGKPVSTGGADALELVLVLGLVGGTLECVVDGAVDVAGFVELGADTGDEAVVDLVGVGDGVVVLVGVLDVEIGAVGVGGVEVGPLAVTAPLPAKKETSTP